MAHWNLDKTVTVERSITAWLGHIFKKPALKSLKELYAITLKCVCVMLSPWKSACTLSEEIKQQRQRSSRLTLLQRAFLRGERVRWCFETSTRLHSLETLSGEHHLSDPNLQVHALLTRGKNGPFPHRLAPHVGKWARLKSEDKVGWGGSAKDECAGFSTASSSGTFSLIDLAPSRVLLFLSPYFHSAMYTHTYTHAHTHSWGFYWKLDLNYSKWTFW